MLVCVRLSTTHTKLLDYAAIFFKVPFLVEDGPIRGGGEKKKPQSCEISIVKRQENRKEPRQDMDTLYRV